METAPGGPALGGWPGMLRSRLLLLVHKAAARCCGHSLPVGPTALKLRLDLIEDVEGSLYFRFHIWSWQLVAKMATKVVCKSLETGKRYRFLAKKEIETPQAYTSDACNIRPYKEICLIR